MKNKRKSFTNASVFSEIMVADHGLCDPLISGKKGNVQTLRNAQTWEGVNPFCYGALLEGEGG